jgi:hypothetical protein
MSTFLLYALTLYIVGGLGVALAFVATGVDRVSHPMTFTLGARLALFPGAVALWPYVLLRWMKARSAG